MYTMLCPESLENQIHLANNIREADRREAWKATGLSSLEVIAESIDISEVSYSIGWGTSPLAFFGSTAEGCVWMLGSKELGKHRLSFWKFSNSIIRDWKTRYEVMWNFVDVENKDYIKWLERLGFVIREPISYGIGNYLFHPFEWRRCV